MDRSSEILTPLHRQVLDTLFSEAEFARIFYLTGGTALAAFYLHHRHSDDLGFFTNGAESDFLWPMLQKLSPSLGFSVETRTPQFIRIKFGGDLKVDFVRDIPFRVGIPVRHGIWLVDSLENMILNKIGAIQGRLDVKDYVDLYFLLKDRPTDILKLLEEAKQKDSSIEPFLWSRLIGDVETFGVLPRMILPLELNDLVDFYKGLRKLILASLKPPR
ncbi:MAG: nucleotidyl transferase AbiEii/AbiGii toxin family protein [Candidatus Omnitrophica bacterium]|nr:nucleotidyl transferase AbiEii/AbiGii toxin family protein [Candidatus Omnitrophota bacterium]